MLASARLGLLYQIDRLPTMLQMEHGTRTAGKDRILCGPKTSSTAVPLCSASAEHHTSPHRMPRECFNRSRSHDDAIAAGTRVLTGRDAGESRKALQQGRSATQCHPLFLVDHPPCHHAAIGQQESSAGHSHQRPSTTCERLQESSPHLPPLAQVRR